MFQVKKHQYTPPRFLAYNKAMVIFATIITLFVLGSLVGWVIELLFRRFVSMKKWINPGFLVGPYIPIYGFGTVVLYLLSNIDLSFMNIDNVWLIIIRIVFIGIIVTIIEFIAGLIFIKGLHLKLWDYSKQKGNILGIICPLFSIGWTIIGALYYFFVNPFLVDFISTLVELNNQIYFLFAGIILGVMLCDFCYSINLATKIRKIAKESKVTIYYAKLKLSLVEKKSEIEKIPFFFYLSRNIEKIRDDVKSYISSRHYTYEERQKDHNRNLKKKIKEHIKD